MRTSLLLALILFSAAAWRASGADEQKPFELKTLLGETFVDCRIIKATPEGITVSHASGVSKIPFENLSDEWQKRFHYSPDKARAFQKEEEARRSLAEAKRRQMIEESERRRSKQLGELVAAENARLRKLEEAFLQQQAGAASAAAFNSPWLLVPLPGAATESLSEAVIGVAGGTVQSATEVLVPNTTPIGAVYTPGTSGGQHYIINEGTVYTNGDGTIYSGYPGYVSPGYVTPGCVNPPIVIYQQGAIRPQVPLRPIPQVNQAPTTTTYRIGRGVIRTGP